MMVTDKMEYVLQRMTLVMDMSLSRLPIPSVHLRSLLDSLYLVLKVIVDDIRDVML